MPGTTAATVSYENTGDRRWRRSTSYSPPHTQRAGEEGQASNLLGEGAFGKVYRSEIAEGQLRAFKVFNSYSALRQEHAIMQRVPPHPGMAICYGVHQAEIDGLVTVGLATEYICGVSVGKLFSQLRADYSSGVLSHSAYWGAIQHILRDVLAVLQHLEQHGVTHNDLSADNIMYDVVQQRARVLDFGLAAGHGEPIASGQPLLLPPDAWMKMAAGQMPRAQATGDSWALGQLIQLAAQGHWFDYRQGPWPASFSARTCTMQASISPHLGEPFVDVAALSRGEVPAGAASSTVLSPYRTQLDRFLNAVMQFNPAVRLPPLGLLPSQAESIAPEEDNNALNFLREAFALSSPEEAQATLGRVAQAFLSDYDVAQLRECQQRS